MSQKRKYHITKQFLKKFNFEYDKRYDAWFREIWYKRKYGSTMFKYDFNTSTLFTWDRDHFGSVSKLYEYGPDREEDAYLYVKETMRRWDVY